MTLSDMDAITEGDVMDVLTERANDSADYDTLATQDDYDAF